MTLATRIATWNINDVNLGLHLLLAWLEITPGFHRWTHTATQATGVSVAHLIAWQLTCVGLV